MPNGSESRCGPFAMVFLPWSHEWAQAGLSNAESALLHCLCSRLEFTPDGKAYAWYPVEEMAAETGLARSTIGNAAGRLKSRGFLGVKEKPYKGKSPVYWVMPGTRWPARKVTDPRLPEEGKGYRKAPLKVTNPQLPLRRNTAVPPADGGAVRPSVNRFGLPAGLFDDLEAGGSDEGE